MTMARVLGTSNAEILDAADGVTNGIDSIWGYGGTDAIYGLGGDDLLWGGTGADYLDGGDGSDSAHYELSSAGVTVNLETGVGVGGEAEGDSLIDIENVTGSDYGDFLIGDNYSNSLSGFPGSDTLKGGGGSDLLWGGSGDDMLKGGGGADYLDGDSGGTPSIDTASYADSDEGVFVSIFFSTGRGGDAEGDTLVRIENVTGSNHDDDLEGDDGVNVLRGSSGDDELEGLGEADTLNGGVGSDTAVYTGSAAGVVVSLISDTAAGGDAEGDELNSIENLTGSDHADELRGDNNANVLTGGSGENTLYGYGGDDGLLGGNDNDTLFGMGGVDTLKGFGGADYLNGDFGADTMLGGSGDDTYLVDDAADVVMEEVGEGALDVVRASATFVLAAESEVEVLETTFQAGTTALDLVGNEFDNTITGNDGVNTIVGGLGLDVMTGAGSGDVFVWTSTAETGVAGAEADVVTEFNRAGGDLLAFNPIDANATGGTNDDAFTFVGVVDVNAGGSFRAPGQIGYFTTATDTYILLNTEADAGVDYQDATIRVAGVHTVDASWFVL
jgi:Ca2+-binding RTX toxin-like protein